MNSPDFIIRPATAADAPQIQALCLAEGWARFGQPDFAQALACSVVRVACPIGRANEVVGFARALTDGTLTLFLCELLIAPDRRGQRIGGALIDSLHEAYPSARMDLLSDADGFYEAQGFRRLGAGYRKSWY